MPAAGPFFVAMVIYYFFAVPESPICAKNSHLGKNPMFKRGLPGSGCPFKDFQQGGHTAFYAEWNSHEVHFEVAVGIENDITMVIPGIVYFQVTAFFGKRYRSLPSIPYY